MGYRSFRAFEGRPIFRASQGLLQAYDVHLNFFPSHNTHISTNTTFFGLFVFNFWVVEVCTLVVDSILVMHMQSKKIV